MKLFHRATFQNVLPDTPLNRLFLTVKTTLPVEACEMLHHGKSFWILRLADTKVVFYQIKPQATLTELKNLCSTVFELQTEPWTLYDRDGNLLDPEQILYTANGTATLKPATHLSKSEQPVTSQKSARTRCNKSVEYSRIVRQKPTCPECKLIEANQQARMETTTK